MKPVIAMLVAERLFDRIFSAEALKKLESFSELRAEPFPVSEEEKVKEFIAGADACVTSWGTCRLSGDILESAPGLKIIVHAAGTVKPVVSDRVWEKGIKVLSCAPAIGIGVAEHSIGLMLSAMYRNHRFNEIIHGGGWRPAEEAEKVMGVYGARVGVVGAGYVGRHFIKLLGMFPDLGEILVYDPFISAEEARESGAVKVDSVEELMSRSDVVSLHAPALPETRHMINSGNLKLLRDGAIIINTARGALINEEDLYRELQSGRITACLDVTDPEPPAPDNPLRKLGNVVFTPHIAGGITDNRFRIGNLAAAELEGFFAGRPPGCEVKKESLERIA